MTSSSPTTEEVLWLYRVLLGRDPENRVALEQATGNETVHDLRRTMMRSDEYQMLLANPRRPGGENRYSYQGDRALLANMVWHSRLSAEAIQLCYRAVLSREIENETVLNRYLDRGLNLFTLVEELLNSAEKMKAFEKKVLEGQFLRRALDRTGLGGGKRVLLFGAYANGNVGDQCQADALASIMGKFSPDGVRSEVCACSWEMTATPSLGRALLRPHDEIMDAGKLRSYDFLLIGGGGILSTPHFPLHSQAWVDGIQALKLRYGFVGVGASAELQDGTRAGAYRQLLEGAEFVSARDEESLEAVRKFRPDAEFMPDPYLVSRALEPRVTASGAPPPRHVVLIPKRPVDKKEEDGVYAMSKLQRKLMAEGFTTTVLMLEPRQDRVIAGAFANVLNAETVEAAEGCVEAAGAVYTMRYHGAIFSLSRRVSCYGIGAKKIRMLYERMGIPQHLLSTDELAAGDGGVFEEASWRHVDAFLDEARIVPQAIRQGLVTSAA